MPDQYLIDLIRTGRSDKALATLYHHFPMVRKMIRSSGGDAADAEDIFQEALILLVRKIHQQHFVLTSKLSTYLYGICRLLWKDELRRRNRPIPHELVHDSPGAEDQLLTYTETEQQARLAEIALDQLGQRCRELLLLFYHGGLKLKDIAAKMGYSAENTAKNQKYKCLEAAKLKLRQLQQSHQTL